VPEFPIPAPSEGWKLRVLSSCAFSDFTVCPLPPTQNHLDVAIEAGEQKYEP